MKEAKPKHTKEWEERVKHFWIRRQAPDRIVLSFNSVERCKEITAMLTEEGGELVAD